MSGDKLYLIHIRECIERIEEYTEGNPKIILQDRKTSDAVLRNLQVLAESTQHLSKAAKQKHLEINWSGSLAFETLSPMTIWE